MLQVSFDELLSAISNASDNQNYGPNLIPI